MSHVQYSEEEERSQNVARDKKGLGVALLAVLTGAGRANQSKAVILGLTAPTLQSYCISVMFSRRSCRIQMFFFFCLRVLHPLYKDPHGIYLTMLFAKPFRLDPGGQLRADAFHARILILVHPNSRSLISTGVCRR